MNILVDIGNTRIKWCVDEDGLIGSVQAIAHKQKEFIERVEQDWLNQAPPNLLAISSVANKQICSQIFELAKRLWGDIRIVIAKSSASAFSIFNAYQQAERLGIDRWLSLIALQHYYPGNCCIIGCGTAITVDCLDEKGLHLGGIISPGLWLMRQSLFKETSDLPYIDQHYPVTLANSTESAIYTGTLLAAVGLIEHSVNNLCHCEKIVLTGGDAQIIAQHLTLKSIIETDFVLKGLSLYCKGETKL